MASSSHEMETDIKEKLVIMTSGKVRPIKNEERLLDRLAWLLEGPSMCTAIAIIESGPDVKFCISANEFCKKTRFKKKSSRKEQDIEEEEEEEEDINEEINNQEEELDAEAAMTMDIDEQLVGRSGNQQLNYIIWIMEYFKNRKAVD